MTLARKFTKCDMYGSVAATLNFNGEDTLQTAPGALITIVTYVFKLYIIVQTSISMLTYAEMKI